MGANATNAKNNNNTCENPLLTPITTLVSPRDAVIHMVILDSQNHINYKEIVPLKDLNKLCSFHFFIA